jgi:uncharacterized membrane protein
MITHDWHYSAVTSKSNFVGMGVVDWGRRRDTLEPAMPSSFIFWPWFTGLIFLIGGLALARKRVAQAAGLDKLVAAGPVLYAVPLAVFAAEHLAGPQILMNVVPEWMPWPLFWAYFVGFALLGAAISIVLMRYVTLAATLLGVMFFLFVLMIHAPRVAANPSDRISWAVALRDLSFGGAAWALAGSQRQASRAASVQAAAGRWAIAMPMIFFGVEHILHPDFAPGVPLGKMMPAWVPLGNFWSGLTAAVLLATGIALLANRKGRIAATWAGLLITLLTLFVYAPMLAVAAKPAEMNEAINYVADTLLFAGAILVMAGALPKERE